MFCIGFYMKMLKIQLHTDELSVICSLPNINYSPVSYLKLKYVVKECGDIRISHYFFPKCSEPFQSADLGLFQVAKFFSVYPFHCFCSYGSDFSLKNMYNFYIIKFVLILILCLIIFSLIFLHVFWGNTSRLSCTSLSVFCSVHSAHYSLRCRSQFCCCILSFLECFCWFHWLLFKSPPVFSPLYCSAIFCGYQISFSFLKIGFSTKSQDNAFFCLVLQNLFRGPIFCLFSLLIQGEVCPGSAFANT